MVDAVPDPLLRPSEAFRGRRAPARRPLAISHRGAHELLPENSIPAFLRAIELGAEAIELDVRATSDGVLVVHHDAELQDGALLSGVPYLSLSSSKLASGIPIPRLLDVLDAIGRRALVFIEAKDGGIEMPLIRAVRSSHADCAIHSFDAGLVTNVKRFFPAIRTGLLTSGAAPAALRRLADAGADDLWHLASDLDAALVRSAHAAGKRVIAWTSNSGSEWRRLSQMGADGICTDDIAGFTANSW